MNKKIILYLLIVLGLLSSIFITAQRYRVESLNDAVELTLDFEEIKQISAITGKTTTEVLNAFKQAGAVSVSISMMTFKEAIDDGYITKLSGNKYSINGNISDELLKTLKLAVPDLKISIFTYDSRGNKTVSIDAPIAYLQQLPIGFPIDDIRTAEKAGFGIIGRIPNFRGVETSSINGLLQRSKELRISKIIFDGDQVLGFKGLEEDTGKALVDKNLLFGKVEFAKQKGEEKLARAASANVIIVHSITAAEMPSLTEPVIQERFQKAVRERDVRLCYIRMFYTASNDILTDNADYVTGIRKYIEKAGYTIRQSHPFEEVGASKLYRAVAAIGVAAGCVLALTSIIELTGAGFAGWLIGSLILCVGFSMLGETGRKIIALLGAIVYPTLGTVIITQMSSKGNKNRLFSSALRCFLTAVLFSVIGGLLVVGLLSQRDFMLRVNQFLGVKVAHLLPVVIVAGAFASQVIWDIDSWQNQKRKFIAKIKELGSNPILIWQAVGVFVVLVLLALMVARSGNDSGMEVSSFELKFRSILDKLLFVRPRTKEFLIGYPALIAGICFALRGKRAWAAPLITLGSFGLVSALNTFCHIHTPIMLSLLRIVNGVIVGGLVGLVVYRIIRRLPGD